MTGVSQGTPLGINLLIPMSQALWGELNKFINAILFFEVFLLSRPEVNKLFLKSLSSKYVELFDQFGL
jgi:hypothetical protein